MCDTSKNLFWKEYHQDVSLISSWFLFFFFLCEKLCWYYDSYHVSFSQILRNKWRKNEWCHLFEKCKEHYIQIERPNTKVHELSLLFWDESPKIKSVNLPCFVLWVVQFYFEGVNWMFGVAHTLEHQWFWKFFCALGCFCLFEGQSPPLALFCALSDMFLLWRWILVRSYPHAHMMQPWDYGVQWES